MLEVYLFWEVESIYEYYWLFEFMSAAILPEINVLLSAVYRTYSE